MTRNMRCDVPHAGCVGCARLLSGVGDARRVEELILRSGHHR